MTAAASSRGLSLFEAAYSEDLESFGLKSAAVRKIRDFCDMIARLAVRAAKEDAYNVAAALAMDSGLLMMYKSDTSIEGQSRTANVEELLNSVKNHVEERHNEMFEEMQADGTVEDGVELKEAELPVVVLGDYLENVSLLSAVDVNDDENGSNKVTLMTVHSSKGLEFPYVYVAGMEENIFPSGGFMATESEVEEERRLFYVAMTRAKKALSFSFASTRMRNGKHESNSPSRFIREIDQSYIFNPITMDDEPEDKQTGMGWGMKASVRFNTYGRSGNVRTETPARKPVMPVRNSEPAPFRRPQPVPKRVPDSEFEPTPVLQLRAGNRIEHNRFGFGVIREIVGTGADMKAKISFDEHGDKILILKYAKIRIADVGK